jgi:hypothetical protein
MENKEYYAQVGCAVGPLLEIKKQDFIEIKKMYSECRKFLWIEEKFNILKENYLEFKKEIKHFYTIIDQNQTNESNLKKLISKKIIQYNRLVFNFLSSVRLYIDQVQKDLNSINPEYKQKFKKKTNILYDDNIEYQIMELLRNHMQHQGLIIEEILIIKTNIKDSFSYVGINVRYEELKKVEGFNKKIKKINEIPTNTKSINIISLLDKYYDNIVTLHDYYRNIISENLKKNFNIISIKISEIFNIYIDKIKIEEKECQKYINTIDNEVVRIAFLVNDVDRNNININKENFLFEKMYLDKLKKYTELKSTCSEKENPYKSLLYYNHKENLRGITSRIVINYIQSI